MIGSFAVMSVGASYEVDKDMTQEWTVTEVGGDLKCQYWPGGLFTGNSAQTRLSVTQEQISSSNSYVYIRGQGESVGNEKYGYEESGGWMSTDRCYANGKYASWTFHSYNRSGVYESFQFNCV